MTTREKKRGLSAYIFPTLRKDVLYLTIAKENQTKKEEANPVLQRKKKRWCQGATKRNIPFPIVLAGRKKGKRPGAG